MPASSSPSGHVLRELGQRCVDRLDRPLLRVVRERVILIGGERLLPPRGAPEREPRPRRRGLAEPFDPEREQPRGHGVDDERHDAADAHRLGAGVDERQDDLGESPAGGDDLVARACAFDLAADRERRVAADVHQIRRRHDAVDRPVRARHREVMHAFGEHGQQRLADQGVLGQRLHGERRDLLDGRLRAPMRREHARTQVAVGHDAPPVAHRDQEARDVLRRHALGGGRHGHPGIRGDRSPADQPTDRAERQPRRLHRLVPGGQPRTHLAQDERLPRGRAEDLVGDVGTDQVAERVLVGAHRRRRALLRQQGELPEHLAVAQEVVEPALRDQLDGALPHHVEVSRRCSRLLQDHGAGGEVLDLDGLRDPRELVGARARRTAGTARGTSPRPRREYAAAEDGALTRRSERAATACRCRPASAATCTGPRP